MSYVQLFRTRLQILKAILFTFIFFFFFLIREDIWGEVKHMGYKKTVDDSRQPLKI